MVKQITSVSNDKILSLCKLHDKKYIKDTAIVESVKVVDELVKLNLVLELYVEEKYLDKYSSLNIPIYQISSSVSKKLSTTTSASGVYALVKVPNYSLFNTNFLVLENIQDPSNLGAIFRTACASNYMDIFLISSVCPYIPKVTRSSMGYNFKLNIVYFDTIEEFLKYKNENDLYLITADMQGENVFKINDINHKFGLVIGNEGQGISSTMQSISNSTISIPMQNGVESLNASVSASILMYTLNKKIKGD